MNICRGLFGVMLTAVVTCLIPEVPLAQGAATAQDTLDAVLVIPNPYSVIGRTWGPKSEVKAFERIRFANLPNTPCTIKIFSSRGNLIITLDHPGKGTNLNWDGRNSNNQYVVSDVYLYVVESATLGRQVGKFIVIR